MPDGKMSRKTLAIWEGQVVYNVEAAVKRSLWKKKMARVARGRDALKRKVRMMEAEGGQAGGNKKTPRKGSAVACENEEDREDNVTAETNDDNSADDETAVAENENWTY